MTHSRALMGATLLIVFSSAGASLVADDGGDDPFLIRHEKEAAAMRAYPFVHAPVAAGQCSVCHDEPGKDGKAALKPAKDTCLMCHPATTEAELKAVVHPPFSQRKCVACHEPHASSQSPLLRAPVNKLCLSCHAAIPENGHPVAQHPTLVQGKLDCRTCHEPHGSPWPKLLKHRASEICIRCHPQ